MHQSQPSKIVCKHCGDHSCFEEETQNKNQKKSSSRQNVRKSAKPVAESDSDSSDPDDYKPDKSLVGKVESPAKKMKTRGVKVCCLIIYNFISSCAL